MDSREFHLRSGRADTISLADYVTNTRKECLLSGCCEFSHVYKVFQYNNCIMLLETVISDY